MTLKLKTVKTGFVIGKGACVDFLTFRRFDVL